MDDPRHVPLKVTVVGHAGLWHSLESAALSNRSLRVGYDPDISAAYGTPADDPPDLIVLAQIRPGEYRDDEIAELRRRFPLTPLIVLLGPWCDGEMRTGQPLAGVMRMSWHRAAWWLSRELDRHLAGRCPAWGWPATITDDERLLRLVAATTTARQVRKVETAPTAALIGLRIDRAGWADAVADTLRDAGLASVWLPPERPVDLRGAAAILWDGDGLPRERLADLAQTVTAWRPVPVLALWDFPRPEDHRAAEEAGAAALVAKPLFNEQLLHEIRQAIGMNIGNSGRSAPHAA